MSACRLLYLRKSATSADFYIRFSSVCGVAVLNLPFNFLAPIPLTVVAIAPLFPPVASNTLTLPRTLPTQRFRPPKRNIPQTAIQRNHVLQRVREYVAEHNPVPPLPLDELKRARRRDGCPARL